MLFAPRLSLEQKVVMDVQSLKVIDRSAAEKSAGRLLYYAVLKRRHHEEQRCRELQFENQEFLILVVCPGECVTPDDEKRIVSQPFRRAAS